MKKIIISAAVAAMAFSTSAVAADKGIDIDVSGQAVVYYETHDDKGANGLFDESNSVGAGGIQLNLDADLGNNFTFGSQLTYLSTLGLEKNLVNGGKQTASNNANGVNDNTVSEIALTKIFIAKKIGNTTLKAGRQELPKSLAPFSYSEGDDVFKNTFDAIVAINTDIPETTVVAGYVSKGTNLTLGTSGDLPSVAGAIYMLTAQTTVIPMTTLTATFYEAKNVLGTNVALVTPIGGASGTNIYWIDAAIAPEDAPLGLTVGLQGGVIAPDDLASGALTADTEVFGVKIGAKVAGLTLTAAYTTVDGDTNAQVAARNLGTNNKTPLYTQLLANQNAIGLDSDTFLIGAGYDAGSIGEFSVNYALSDVGNQNGTVNSAGNDVDYSELDLVYKIKAGGVQYAAMAIFRDVDTGGAIAKNTINPTAGATEDTILRVWARYSF